MQDFIPLLQHCAKNNPAQFNRDKAVEEATEFIEAVTKRQTKHPDNPKRPEKIEILKEYGDFQYRGLILLIQEFPELTFNQILEKVEEHMTKKLTDLQRWKDEGKYNDGL